jgi:hypothetical protein
VATMRSTTCALGASVAIADDTLTCGSVPL